MRDLIADIMFFSVVFTSFLMAVAAIHHFCN